VTFYFAAVLFYRTFAQSDDAVAANHMCTRGSAIRHHYSKIQRHLPSSPLIFTLDQKCKFGLYRSTHLLMSRPHFETAQHIRTRVSDWVQWRWNYLDPKYIAKASITQPWNLARWCTIVGSGPVCWPVPVPHLNIVNSE